MFIYQGYYIWRSSLLSNKKNIQKKFPKKPNVFIISRDSDTSPIDDLNCDVCDRIEKADFIIISGSEPEKHSHQF